MAQEARNVSGTNQAVELHVLGAGPAQGGSFPEDFVAAVERRAALSQDNPIDYGQDEPWHSRVPRAVAVAAAAFAAGILVVAGIMFTGDSPTPQADELAVAANAADQQVAEPTVVAGDIAGGGDAAVNDVAAGGTVMPLSGEPGANQTDNVGLPTLVGFGDLTMGQPPALTQLSAPSGEPGFIAVAMPFNGDPFSGDTTDGVAETSGTPLEAASVDAVSDVIVPPIPEEEPASVFAAVDMTTPSGASDNQTESIPVDGEIVTADFVAPVDGVRVQLASYGSEQRAQKGWDNLQAEHADMFANLEPVIEKADLENGTFYRLRVGSFASTGEAGQFCGALSDRQVSCIVVPR